MLKPADSIRKTGRKFRSTKGEGCIECAGTGFRGRTAIHELLDLTDTFREMILDASRAAKIRSRTAKRECISFASRHLIKCGAVHHAERDQQGHVYRDDALRLDTSGVAAA